MEHTALKCPPIQDNLISTLNKMGYMMAQPEALNQAFIDFAATAQAPVLEIGCAYGVATLAALHKGAHVIANDLDPRHLTILNANAVPEHRKRLQLRPGRMPDDLAFLPESFSAVLASRVLNFVPPSKLQHCFDAIYQWLQKGGQFFYLGGSPYMGTYEKFLPQYQLNKLTQSPWPGFIEDMPRYTAPGRAENLPDFVTLLDLDEVKTLMEEAGFNVLSLSYSPVDDHNPASMKGDGREYISAIGVKS